MSEPLSRERINRMSLDEVNRRWSEIRRWLAQGARDGEPAKSSSTKRGEGHVFTRAEIDRMSDQEINENWPQIQAQMESGQLK